jgi:RNA polymerase sigma-70 factor (ECF subfamily)
VLATLVRHTDDLQLAEDVAQDAVLRALDTWPRTGIPPQPRAWPHAHRPQPRRRAELLARIDRIAEARPAFDTRWPCR